MVLDGLELRRVLDAKADVDGIHPLDGAVHRRLIGDRAWHVFELAAKLRARAHGVAHEQAHVTALIQQPSRDRRADQAGPANDKDPLDPHGIPSRGPNRPSM